MANGMTDAELDALLRRAREGKSEQAILREAEEERIAQEKARKKEEEMLLLKQKKEQSLFDRLRSGDINVEDPLERRERLAREARAREKAAEREAFIKRHLKTP